MKNIIKLIISIAICELAGVLGSFFTRPNIPTWYNFLVKPTFAPPNWLFGPVWTGLFLLMGISLYLVWSKGFGNQTVRAAMFIFVIHLIVNILWSAVFFGLRFPLGGFFVIVALWFLIILTMIYFSAVSKLAAFLLIPYLLWTSFASVLNFMIYKLN
ncbi:MAG: tryptophan-rich sensory protein [candidate division WOR-3 bacterium]|nr:tryptophan-rich sensory protein [candidate division WOR-3 bacterium]MDW7987343.1 TspO/MBR family protein [candidate division WOR-3 bacterium]